MQIYTNVTMVYSITCGKGFEFEENGHLRFERRISLYKEECDDTRSSHKKTIYIREIPCTWVLVIKWKHCQNKVTIKISH